MKMEFIFQYHSECSFEVDISPLICNPENKSKLNEHV